MIVVTYEEYKEKEEKRLSIVIRHLENGVDFEDIHNVYIDESVRIDPGVYIGPCVTLKGETTIGAGTCIFQNSRIVDSVIGENVEIQSSFINRSRIGDGSEIGPFAYRRPDSNIGQNCKIGDFVEVKNSSFGDGSKSAHLTYIGDSDIGKDVNLGCGIVFVNYDGTRKTRSTVGDDVFIGCNTNLISPVTVGDGAYIAAGSTVTRDVPEDALCVARAKQKNIKGWASRAGLYRKK